MTRHARWLLPLGLALGWALARGPSPAEAPLAMTLARHPPVAASAAEGSPDEASAPSPALPPAAPIPPPPTPSSWVVPLELGWDGAAAGTPLRREIPFRPDVVRARDTRFEARITDAAGGHFVCEVPVRGLIPLELAGGRDELVLGDEVLSARAPLLLRLPDLPLPARVELLRPDGELAAVLDLQPLEGEVVARVQ